MNQSLFRKKPTVVEAHRWTRNDNDEPGSLGNDHMALWLGRHYRFVVGDTLQFRGADGRLMVAVQGDYILRQDLGDAGEDFWPVTPETFRATYEPELTDGTQS